MTRFRLLSIAILFLSLFTGALAKAAPLYGPFTDVLVEMMYSPYGLKLTKEIGRAALRMGESKAYMVSVAEKESNLDPNAKNRYTSATGLYQFLDSTWAGVVGRYGAKYELTLQDRTDPYKASIGMALFTKENRAILKNKLGRSPTNKELYLAHFAGANGAVKLINAPPHVRVGEVLGYHVEKANPNIRGKSVAQAIAILTRGVK
jgi:hypothetical protein